MLCGVLVLGYFLYKVVELRKKRRNRKTKLRPNRIGQFLDNLPPPGQTAPLKNDLLHEMPDQSALNENFCLKNSSWLRLRFQAQELI
ncbi:hypothetical protein T4E_5348 [Trichinella pseudospiralis]|uniref:Uncharacterized protein n=1 Tax=Trichinella pseudospiralis TaxID=6337 RepID=A0A0V0XCX8_TRIPS|nr:hypothetical protein T4E_5348 [Trichinella pseudospiralis]